MSLKLGHATVAELEANDIRTTTLTGTAFDLREYVGDVMIILHSDIGTGTTPTLDGKIQDGDTSGGVFADVTGATFTQVTDAAGLHEAIIIKANEVARWIKFIGTVGGTPSFGYGVTLIGFKKQR